MNIQEKRKLEELVRAHISKAHSAYNARRKTEKEAIIQKLEAHPPAELSGLVAEYKKEQERHTKAVQALEAKAKKHGYDIIDNYKGVHLDYSASHPSIETHEAETAAQRVRFDAITDSYVLDVWSEQGEMQTLVARLADELEKITTSI